MMPDNILILRKIIVVCSALIYWTGVVIHAYQIRKRTGHSPNVCPRSLREKMFWAGWFFVITGWIGQPFLLKNYGEGILFSFINELYQPSGIIPGVLIAVFGYAGTLWCYAVLGDSWRMGINRKEKVILIRYGPYQFVRHPIYLFQIMILIGMFFLLPTLFSFIILLIHIACVIIKALDEEAYLISIYGSEYRGYMSNAGMLLPKVNRFFRSKGKKTHK
jgi:protein-S-isoprenylcysteine O-methyltransferase Ste14